MHGTCWGKGHLSQTAGLGLGSGRLLGVSGLRSLPRHLDSLSKTMERHVQIPMAAIGSWEGEPWWGRAMSWAWCCRPFSSQLLHSFWNRGQCPLDPETQLLEKMGQKRRWQLIC